MRPVPEQYQISQPYGFDQSYPVNGGMHHGIDYATPVGTPGTIRHTGTIVVTRTNYPRGLPGIANGAWGTYVEVECPNGERWGYAHLSDWLVVEGQWVGAGTPCYLTGNTGTSTGPHLHEQRFVDGVRVDPGTDYEEEPMADYGFPGIDDAFDVLVRKLGAEKVGRPLHVARYMDFASNKPEMVTQEKGVLVTWEPTGARMAYQLCENGRLEAVKLDDGSWTARFYAKAG